MASELVEFEDGTIGGGIHSWSTTFVIESIDKCFLKFCKARSNATWWWFLFHKTKFLKERNHAQNRTIKHTNPLILKLSTR